MKKIAFSAFLIVLSLLTVSAMAVGQRVFDNAHLFTDFEAQQLENQIEVITNEYETDIVILTTNNTGLKSSGSYADDYYDRGNFGYGDDYSGVLLLINMQAREPHISTTGSMVDILDDNRIEAMLDTQYDYLAAGDYYDAMAASLNDIERYLSSGTALGQHRYAGDSVNPFTLSWLAISLGAGLIVALIVTQIIRASYKKSFKPVQYDHQTNAKLSLSVQNDTKIDSKITKQYIPPAPPPSSSGGMRSGSSGPRSTTHVGSSGRTHGGGTGRKF